MGNLGFSDLTEDEALLVALYRDWIKQSENKAIFERNMLHVFSCDTIHSALGNIFLIFKNITTYTLPRSGVGDLLSKHEELLLDALAVNQMKIAGDEAASNCSWPNVRPTGEIHQSGNDFLSYRINHTQWRIAQGF